MNAENVILRPFIKTDQEQILDILTSNTVNRTYMLPDYETRADAIPLFNRLVDLSTRTDRYVRCITLGNVAVGFVNDVEIKTGIIELGYVIHPAYHSQGLMTRALSLALQEIWESGYETVLCGAFEENKASIRVMEKCGMLRQKQTDELEYRGAIRKCVYYAKSR